MINLADVRPRIREQRGDHTRNVFHRDWRGHPRTERLSDLIGILDRIRRENQEAFLKSCRPCVHHRQTRAVQRLLG